MRVRIAPGILLIAPLVLGENLREGDEVEVDDVVAAAWIVRGWATAVAGPQTDDRRSAPD